MMKLDRKRAELELERAGKLNPGNGQITPVIRRRRVRI